MQDAHPEVRTISKTKKLIEIVTKTDIDDFLFLRRDDTHQTISHSDLELLKEISPNYPLPEDCIKNGKVYLPSEAVPSGANAVVFLTSRYGESTFIPSMYFCNLTPRVDDGIRTLQEGELDPEPRYGTIRFSLMTPRY